MSGFVCLNNQWQQHDLLRHLSLLVKKNPKNPGGFDLSKSNQEMDEAEFQRQKQGLGSLLAEAMLFFFGASGPA